MSTGLLIESLNEFKDQGKRAYESGDFLLAKELILKASGIAMQMARMTNESKTRIYYEKASQDLANFANEKCSNPIGAKVSVTKETSTKKVLDKPTAEDKEKKGFNAIAGLDDVKKLLKMKVVDPLNKPDRAAFYKVNPVKTMQIMLYGPPGTGKTMFADALGVELDMVTFRAKASELIDPYLGQSSRKLQDFMEEVKASEEQRILIFIDEFDAIATKRSNSAGGGDAGGEMNRLVNTLLQEVDDLVKSNTDKTIVFLVTTNRPWAIDSAVLRGKRFDTQIYVGVPDRDARLFLLGKVLKAAPKADDFSYEELADRLANFSAADITAICDKITDLPLERDYLCDKRQVVTKADCEKVLSTYKNSITSDVLEDYEKYKSGKKVH